MSLRQTTLIILLATILSLVSGCGTDGYMDVTQQVAKSQKLLFSPDVELTDVAWLDDDNIAFINRYRRGDYRITLYSLTAGTAREIVKMPINEHCHPGSSILKYIQRMPNGNLGYAHHCHRDGISGFLYQWDRKTERVEVLQFYDSFSIGAYAFSPDMSELIQERAIGRGLSNELYLVSQDGEMNQLFPSFQRVRSPSWFPEGEKLTFAGTEEFPQGNSEDLRNLWEIEEALYHPWDIYVVDRRGGNPRIILPEGGNVAQLKWSPTDGRVLAFSGSPNKREGIWVLDIKTSALTRIWPYVTAFDWSPDGRKMIIIAREGEGGAERTYPVIVDIPAKDN